MARPVWTPTDAQGRAGETMAAYGIPEADIGRVLGVSKPTLRKHCGTELDTGATRANSKVADVLFYGICGGTGKPAFKDERARVTAAIFWMKTRGAWSETRTHKHTGVANGDPIEVVGANAAWLRLNVILYNLLSAFKRVGLPEEFHTARPKRLRFLLLNTVGKVVRHARETLLRCTKQLARALAGAPRTLFSLNRPTLAGV